MTITIGILAGEASGDNLGAGLMAALRLRHSDLRFVGIGGSRMQAEGLQSLASMELLAVNGFKDPILKLPKLVRLLLDLRRFFSANPPAVFIGVDFNVFNLLLENLLKRRGIATVHYVSPSVYAWRRGRVKRISRSADTLLALYPFEAEFYADTEVDVRFVGHPMADAIALDAGDAAGREAARRELQLAGDGPLIAILPGSRTSEIEHLLERFLEAATLIAETLDGVRFVVPCMRKSIEAQVLAALALRPSLVVTTYHGDARLALTACDAAIVKSGSSTLEAMLLRRPMVVSYRLGYWTALIARWLVRTEFVALPNILAGEQLVPELLQEAATPERLAENLLEQLDKAQRQPEYLARFEELHRQLKRDANERAADAVDAVLAVRTQEGNGAV
ncbi:MAG: lipid-A-disaccharide synthase [Pseudomonadales bacterium]